MNDMFINNKFTIVVGSFLGKGGGGGGTPSRNVSEMTILLNFYILFVFTLLI
jgi:hypothetical protein